MAIKTQNQPQTFVEGRGGGRGLPVDAAEDMARESETEIDPFPDQSGATAQDHGNKPIFGTGETPFHSGRGPGRGHGAEK